MTGYEKIGYNIISTNSQQLECFGLLLAKIVPFATTQYHCASYARRTTRRRHNSIWKRSGEHGMCSRIGIYKQIVAGEHGQLLPVVERLRIGNAFVFLTIIFGAACYAKYLHGTFQLLFLAIVFHNNLLNDVTVFYLIVELQYIRQPHGDERRVYRFGQILILDIELGTALAQIIDE